MRPTTTGGKLISEFITNNTKLFPIKFFNTSREETYIDTIDAIIVASKEMYNDKKTILINFESRSTKIL
tara:strand:+ start:52 stop:258 length:207 start_codon:yes stop_codon:yes gene_type:complete